MSREQWGNGYIRGLKAGLILRTNFFDYCVAMHQGEDSPLGDFVFDMIHDEDFPKSINGRLRYDTKLRKRVPYREDQYCMCIMDHLISSGACFGAKQAFAELWKEWKRIGDN